MKTNLTRFWHRKEIDGLLDKCAKKHTAKLTEIIELFHLAPEIAVSLTRTVQEAYFAGAKEWTDKLHDWLEELKKNPSVAATPVAPELRLQALQMAQGDVEKAKELVAFLAGEEK